ncbi:MAG: PQQ-binding-like beta-propeller repeat protein, partial [Myxococcales bacterium]|nr:PQQ-binding-like beta-propeller repeat protein [Myxococcales bacterium]
MFAPGDVVADRYKIIRVIGQGGAGITYEAERDGARVAVKQLVLRGMDGWKHLELFEREARVLQQLDHPAIPRYIDSLSQDGDGGPCFLLVQQLAPGRSLQERVDDGLRLDEPALKKIAARLLDVLIYLQGLSPPVYHRDIKPHNVILGDDGEVHLVDFGAVRDTYRSTIAGGSTVVGTYGYMAPEQFRGQAGPATDLYGLGATILFLATHTSPAELPQAKLRIQFRERVRLSPAFCDWIARVVEPAPEDRFEDAAAALEALRAERALAPIGAAPLTRPRSPAPFVVMGAAVAMIAAATAALFLFSAPPQESVVIERVVAPPPTIAPPPPQLDAPDPQPSEPTPPTRPQVGPWWPESQGETNSPLRPRWSREIGYTTFRSTIHVHDGKVIVNSNGSSWASHRDDQDGVYVLSALTGEVEAVIRPSGGGEKDTNGVALAPAGLFFGTDQDVLHHVSWTGEALWKTAVAGDVEGAPALGDFNGDGVLDVAVGSEGGGLYLLDGRDGSVRAELTSGRGEYGQAGFIGAPALRDVTGDGRPDVFAPCRDQVFRAVDGATGALLWSYQGGSGMHSAPLLIDVEGDGVAEVAFSEAYSTVYLADARTGELRWQAEVEHPGGGIEGLFGPLAWYPDAGCVAFGTAWWGDGEGFYCLSAARGAQLWRYTEPVQKISSGAVVGDVDGAPGAELVFGTEAGTVVALNHRGEAVWKHDIGGPVECTPTLADLDGDGRTDLLVAANDGDIEALITPGAAPPTIGYHRGDAKNTGDSTAIPAK